MLPEIAFFLDFLFSYFLFSSFTSLCFLGPTSVLLSFLFVFSFLFSFLFVFVEAGTQQLQVYNSTLVRNALTCRAIVFRRPISQISSTDFSASSMKFCSLSPQLTMWFSVSSLTPHHLHELSLCLYFV